MAPGTQLGSVYYPRKPYSLEVFQGPLLAPNRVTGLAGAYTALAEDVEGAAVNSAAPAVRDGTSHSWFDYDLSAGISFPGAYTATDFDNSGTVPNAQNARVSDFLDVNLGGLLQFGEFGVAATADFQQYKTNPADAHFDIGRLKALVGYGLLDGQVVLGAGARIVTAQLSQGSRTLLTMTGASPEIGALIMPTDLPFRLGATLRGRVSGTPIGAAPTTSSSSATFVEGQGEYVTPSLVVLPWETEFGFAYQLGARPINPGWQDPKAEEALVRNRIERARGERARDNESELAALSPAQRGARAAELAANEAIIRRIEDLHLAEESERLDAIRIARERNWPREKILILGSVLVTGKSTDAVSLEGFLINARSTVGQSISYTPRVGLEGEPLHDRLVVRSGTYIEPSRFEGGTARQHFTFGGDVKLWGFDAWGILKPTVWKTSVFVDIAPRYANGGIAFGVWH